MGKKDLTLCIITKSNELLLGKKLRGLGHGVINFPGGKVEDGETPLENVVREVKEEIGLEVSNLDYQGVIHFTFDDEPEKNLFVHVYSTSSYSGTLISTPELIPEWVEFSKIPYHDMWEADRIWLPLVLQGKSIQGRFHYDNKDSRKILWHQI